MIRVLAIALCLVTGSAFAESIVPVTVKRQGVPFTPAGDGRVELPLRESEIPAGTRAIVGWTGWIQHGAGVTYSNVELWHDGGTPHQLEEVRRNASGPLTVIMLPAPGHTMAKGDRLFVSFACHAPMATKCTVQMTVFLRVED